MPHRPLARPEVTIRWLTSPFPLPAQDSGETFWISLSVQTQVALQGAQSSTTRTAIIAISDSPVGAPNTTVGCPYNWLCLGEPWAQKKVWEDPLQSLSSLSKVQTHSLVCNKFPENSHTHSVFRPWKDNVGTLVNFMAAILSIVQRRCSLSRTCYLNSGLKIFSG